MTRASVGIIRGSHFGFLSLFLPRPLPYQCVVLGCVPIRQGFCTSTGWFGSLLAWCRAFVSRVTMASICHARSLSARWSTYHPPLVIYFLLLDLIHLRIDHIYWLPWSTLSQSPISDSIRITYSLDDGEIRPTNKMFSHVLVGLLLKA